MKRSTQKIASPWGGLIKFWLNDAWVGKQIKGVFEVQIKNAVKAPMFVLGETSNKEWKKIRKYSPPWSVLRVPGQLQVNIQTLYINKVDDMEAVMAGWKDTWDMIDKFVGIPPNLKPAEERLKMSCGTCSRERPYIT